MLDPNRLYTIEEARPYIGSRSSAYRDIRKKKLLAVKQGRLTKLRGCDIISYVNNLPTIGGATPPSK